MMDSASRYVSGDRAVSTAVLAGTEDASYTSDCERREKGKAPPGESQISTKKGGGQWVGKDVYVRLFSRHLEVRVSFALRQWKIGAALTWRLQRQDMTAKYPDILQLMPELLSPVVTNEDGSDSGVQSFIIDAEIVAIDPITKALLTFQILANRARKDVSIHEVKVKVGVFAFDLMYLNGQVSLAGDWICVRCRLDVP